MERIITERFQKIVETETWEQGPQLTIWNRMIKATSTHSVVPFDSSPRIGCHSLFGNCWWNETVLQEDKILYKG